MAQDATDAVTQVVLDDAPPGAVIVGLSIAPEGRRAAALTFLPTANYLMDDVYEWSDGAWTNQSGGSGGPGVNWSGSDVGVLRFSGEAPHDAKTAVVAYDGDEHFVPINHGHFLFVAWDTPFSDDPKLLRFD
jgi:hypothetical protein